MRRLTNSLFILLLIGFSSGSLAQLGLFGPSDYNECILEGMKGVTSNVAAKAIAHSCRKKFPSETKKDSNSGKNLTSNELAKVRLNGSRWKSSAEIEEYIYNGNDFGIKNIVVAYSIWAGPKVLQEFELIFFSGGLFGCVEGKTSDRQDVAAFPPPESATGYKHELRSAVKC